MEAPHNVKLVVDVAYIKAAAVLMTRYRDPDAYDGQHGLFLPNDLLLDREDPDDAARRVLRDQLGIEGASIRLAFAESFTGMDRTWHLALHYVATSPDTDLKDAAEHLTAPQWFPLAALPDRADVAHGGWALRTLARIAQA